MPTLFQARDSPVPPPPSPDGPPNIAQIVLPPGLTLEQYLTLQGQAVTIAICVAVAFAIICWDYVVLVTDELLLYRTGTKQLWKTPATWAFVVLRYAAFLATFPALFFTSIQSQHCQAAVVSSQVGAVLVVACSGIIFCNRVVAVWSNNKIIIAILAVLWSGMMGCWIAVAVQYHAITGPPTPFGSNCQMQPIVSWAPISYASSVGFDIIVLLLTLFKLNPRTNVTHSAIARQISTDNVAYFLLTTVTNIAVLSIQALGEDHALIKPTAVPFSTVVTVAMAQRVYLNLKLFHQRAAAGERMTQPNSFHSSASGARAPVSKAIEVDAYKSSPQSWETERKRGGDADMGVEMPLVYIQRETVTSGGRTD